MHTDSLSQINEVINSLVKKGNYRQANNLNKLFMRLAQEGNPVVNNSPSGTTADASGNPTGEGGGLPPAAPPAGTPPPGKPQQAQNSGAKQTNTDMMNIIKQFIALKNWANKQNPPAFYSYSRGQFYSEKDGQRISAPTVGELFPKLGVTAEEVQELKGDVLEQANKITAEITSANAWTGASADASKAINDKYDLGFNFENNQYYIADPNNPTDAEYKESVAALEQVYNELGAYYNKSKALPPSLKERGSTAAAPKQEQEATKPGVDVSQLPKEQGSPDDMTATPAEVNSMLQVV